MPRPTTLLAAAALTLVGTAASLIATSAASASTLKLAQSPTSSPTITIGSTNFPEQVIVANLYSDVLQHAGFKTNLRTDLGTRTAVEPALAHGSTCTPTTPVACSSSWSRRTPLRPPSSARTCPP